MVAMARFLQGKWAIQKSSVLDIYHFYRFIDGSVAIFYSALLLEYSCLFIAISLVAISIFPSLPSHLFLWERWRKSANGI